MKIWRPGPQLVFTLNNRFFRHQAGYILLPARPGGQADRVVGLYKYKVVNNISLSAIQGLLLWFERWCMVEYNALSPASYKEMPSIFADQLRPRIRVPIPMRGKGRGRLRGLSHWVQLCTHHVTWSPHKLWRSTSIFKLCFSQKLELPS